MMDWKLIEPWEYAVTHVASEYHRKFKMIELEDIRQTLYEWFPAHINKFTEWNELGGRDAKNLIYRSLRNYALDYCQYQKAKSLGYDVSDLYYYDPVIVEALLPAVLRSEWGVTHKLNLGRPGRPSAPNEGGNLQAMMIEVDSAYHKLSTEDKQLLFLRYAESMEYADIAKELELVSPDATRMRTTRVIRKLVRLMGGMKPWLDRDIPDNVTDEPDELVSQDDSAYSEEHSEDTREVVD
jgi:RNA polymerase sigma factor (sigma-70 family)